MRTESQLNIGRKSQWDRRRRRTEFCGWTDLMRTSKKSDKLREQNVLSVHGHGHMLVLYTMMQT